MYALFSALVNLIPPNSIGAAFSHPPCLVVHLYHVWGTLIRWVGLGVIAEAAGSYDDS